MAGGGAKKRLAENETLLARYSRALPAIVLVYLVVRLWWWGATARWLLWLLWAASAVLINVAFSQVRAHATPVYAEDGRLVDGGGDMRQSGMVEYCFDAIYVLCACLLLGLLSDKAWLLGLTIPGYGGYKLWITFIWPYFEGGGGGGGDGIDLSQLSAADRKKYEKQQRRQERKENRVKYRRAH